MGAVSAQIAAARAAQPGWAAAALAERLATIRRLRQKIAADPEKFLASLARRPNRTPAESLLAELLPLADACRFLERAASRLLAPKRLGRRGRPAWLSGVAAEVRREPFGLVLIIAPDNYPLLLPGVQAVQALAAGNAVVIKPAPGCGEAIACLAQALLAAGLPVELCQVLGETTEDALAALAGGVDHVVLTGSAATGRAVLSELAPALTPAIMELSGNDAVFVFQGADLALAADALAYGLRLNGGATCIAPRRVFVPRGIALALEDELRRRLAAAAPVAVPASVRARLDPLLAEAERHGARFLPVRPEPSQAMLRPTAVLDADPGWGLLREDVFAPVLSMVPVRDMDEALTLDARCPYALGASIFGPAAQARALAQRVRAGSVSVNDLIVPTADPRLPFGGHGQSGFGVTRGAEGLLAMTRIKTVSIRGGRFRPHYDPALAGELEAARAYLRAAHGKGAGARLSALARLVLALPRLRQSK